jgi:hypothetical protein
VADPSRSKASLADRTAIVPQAPADRTEVVRQAPADRTEILRPAGPAPADRTEILRPAGPAPADRTEILKPSGPAPADRTEILRPAGPTLLTDRAAPPSAAPQTERVFAPPSPSTLVLGDPRPGPLPRPTPAQPVSINKMLIWINLACFAAILLLILFFGLFS